MAGARSRSRFKPTVVSIAVASCFSAGPALANPSGANVVRGTAAIHQQGNLLQITNSPNAIINWQSFSIGANEITRFIQQSQSSAVLNRVTTQNPSVIMGSLQSRLASGQVGGKVFLINPNGILFGKSSRVDVGGLVASSLQMSDADFVAKRMRFTETPGAKPVINEGTIRTRTGGNVYLIGPDVINSGLITTPRGEVVLAAGKSVELVDPSTPSLRVEIVADENQATNVGQIVADTGRVGIYAGLINNSGTIRADSAVAEGGRILLKASKSVTLEGSSVLSVRGQGGGQIEVLGGDSVHVAGLLDAAAPQTGNGGFIETSAHNVAVDPGTVVTTAAAKGKSGMWLIDPTNFTVSPGTAPQIASGIGATTLSSNLATTDVVIATAAAGVEPGGILVDVGADVSWNSVHSLTFVAHSNVVNNASVTNAGTGGISFYAGWDGTSPASAPVVQCCGQIGVNAPLTTGGEVKLVAGFFITQTSAGVITADRLLATAPAISLSADFGGARNMVNTLAGSATDGSFFFFNAKPLTIDTVGGVSGVAATNNNGSATVNIVVDGGSLTVNRNVAATAGTSVEGPGQASIFLATRTSGNISVRNGAVVSAVAGDGGAFGGSGGNATVELNTAAGSGGSITVAQGSRLDAFGGNAFGGGSSGSGSGGDGRVTLLADGSVTVDNSTIRARGGEGNGVEAQGGRAEIFLTASTGPVVVGNTSALSAIAGVGGSSGGGGAHVQLFGQGITVSASTITATGGAAGGGSSGGSAQVSVQGNNSPVSIAGSTITATGGAGTPSGPGSVNIQGTSSVAISNSTISAGGETGFINVNANGITVGSSTLQVSGDGTGCCNSSIGLQSGNNLSATSSTLRASAADGAEGTIYLSGGTVNTSSSLLTTANSTAGYISVNGNSGNVTLGQLVTDATGGAYVYSSGSIVDGNGDTNNIQASRAGFTSTAGVGTIGNPLETQVAQIEFLNGGSGPVGVMNTGNLLLGGSFGGLSTSGAAQIEATGTLTTGFSGNAGAGLTLIGNGIRVNRFLSSNGDVKLDAKLGDLNIVGDSEGGAQVSGNNVYLMGANVNVGSATQSYRAEVIANNLLSVVTPGNVAVTGGNLSGADALMRGLVDVAMTIGGMLQLNGNSTAPTIATVEAGSPQTINLSFTGLSADGYSVNGKLNAIEDNGSGFFVMGLPAVLGENMFVTYGGPPPFTDVLTATINQQVDVLADQLKAGDTGEGGEEKDKKKLPFCDG